MANFTAEGRLGNLGDVQKVFQWELFIPSIAELDMDDMVLRVRNVVIPGRTIQPIESFFMGTKQFFPGRTDYPGTFSTQFEEFEDGIVFKAIDSWMQLIFDHSTAASGGKQGAPTKRDISRDVTLKMYKGDGDLVGSVKFFNTWPQNIADSTLDYTGSDSVKFDVTWQYDFWRPE